MARTIAGTLVDPEGTGLNGAVIHITSIRNNLSGVPSGIEETFSTDANGAYSQSLEVGVYNVAIAINTSKTNLGKITVVDGTASVDLMTLLNTNFVVDPNIIIDGGTF